MKRIIDTLVTWGPLGVFVIALIDSAGLPNPGGLDYVLLFLSWKQPGTAYLSATLAVTGSLIGTYILYRIARKGGETFLDKHTRGGGGARFRRWFGRYGLVTVFVPALVPIIPLPMKVFVICSGAFGVNPVAFMAAMALGRIPRYFGLAYLGRSLGEDAGTWLKLHARDLGFGALGLFVSLFILIKATEWFRKPGPDKLNSDHDLSR